jgi:hypothetical protein
MKRIAFFLLIFSAVASCKKEGTPAEKEKLLSKIYENHALQYEFEYSSDKRLKKVKRYNGGSVAPVATYEYQYDGKGQLIQKTSYNLSGKPTTKFLYQWTDQGQVAKYTAIDLSGADSGEVSYWGSYAYNEKKWIVKLNNFWPNDDPGGYHILEYNNNGALLERKSYSEKPGGSTLELEYDYVGAQNRIHPAFRKAFIEPANDDLPFYDAKSILYTNYHNGLIQTVHTYTMTDRKSEAGVWVEQTITYQQTFGGGAGAEVRKMRYEYIDL